MHLFSRWLFASALLLPSAVFANEPAVPSEHRLSPAEIEKVLENAARSREATESHEGKRKLEVHGEIGVSVGTNGYRSTYGTANVALPRDGFISLSFDATDFGSRRRPMPAWR